MKEWISISIALIATLISLASFWMNNKREKEKHTPVFIIEKVTKFNSYYSLQIKNIRENYEVIKEAYSSNRDISVEYAGVMDVVYEKQKNGKVTSSKLYRGHTFNVFIYNNNKTEGKIFIKGVDFSGKEFKVCTPIIQFKNGNKITNIQHRYLEFI